MISEFFLCLLCNPIQWCECFIYLCCKFLFKTCLANESVNVFKFLEMCWYWIKSKCLSKSRTLGNNIRSVGFLIVSILVICNTTSYESNLMIMWLIPNEISSVISSINALYSVIFFVDLLIQIPWKITNLSFGAKMDHVAEDRFYVLWLAPSAYPTNGFKDLHICDEM